MKLHKFVLAALLTGPVAVAVCRSDDERRHDTDGAFSASSCGPPPTGHFRSPCREAGEQLARAAGLDVEYATRSVAHHAHQLVFWPHDSEDPSHLLFCIGSGREELADGRLQPSLQAMDLESGEVHTVVRGMSRCDAARTTPWGTVLVSGASASGASAVYELLFDPGSPAQYSIRQPDGSGAPSAIVDDQGDDASAIMVERAALPPVFGRGLLVLPSGVVISGGLRAGSGARGAIFKFIPSTIRTRPAPISVLGESPLTAGRHYALHGTCTTELGERCESAAGAWLPVSAGTPDREGGVFRDHRPEALEIDPHFAGPGVRFCVVDGGAVSSSKLGRIFCAVDSAPEAVTDARSVVVRRLLDDSELNQPKQFAFHPTIPGLFYVIEKHARGVVWSCQADASGRALPGDCARLLSLRDPSADPAGILFEPNGESAYLSIQHSADGNMPLGDGYATDDILFISGGATSSAAAAHAIWATPSVGVADLRAAR